MLRTHIIARRWSEPGQGERAVTACGEPLFKGRCDIVDSEWSAERRIGGAIAVASGDFYPDRHACRKCQAKWEALEV